MSAAVPGEERTHGNSQADSFVPTWHHPDRVPTEKSTTAPHRAVYWKPSVKPILIADDNPLTLAFLDEMIRRMDCVPVQATDGDQAIVLATTQAFALMLIDANMPGRDGAATLAAIRAGGGPNQRACAVLTSADSSIRQLDAQAAGFADVLHKPFTFAELVTLFERSSVPLPATFDWPPLLDEAQSLTHSGGNIAIAVALRTLFIKELDQLPEELEQFAGNLDQSALRDRLHRLDASAGICGTPQLAEACRTLRSRIGDQAQWPFLAIAEFLSTCEKTREALKNLLAQDASG